MSLSLYRRHRRDCKAGHAEELRTGEFDERKKGWKRCDCPIFASGTLAKKFRRQSTGHWEWDHAKAVSASWETAGSWDGHIPEPAPVSSATAKEPQSTTITEATEAFLAKCMNRGIRPNTYSKYKTFTNQVEKFSRDMGYVNLDQGVARYLLRYKVSQRSGGAWRRQWFTFAWTKRPGRGPRRPWPGWASHCPALFACCQSASLRRRRCRSR